MYTFIHYQARDVMTPAPVTVGKETTLSEVGAIFSEHDFNGLPVVDEDQGLLGMITKLDLLKAFASAEENERLTYDEVMTDRAFRVMTKNPHVVNRGTPLTRLLHYMVESGHKSVPVVEGDRVVGVVAREDIIRALRLAAEEKLPDRPLSSD